MTIQQIKSSYGPWKRMDPAEAVRYTASFHSEDRTNEIWENDRYVVGICRGEVLHQLSIKRVDKDWIHDWRDLQMIKNDLIGPEHEAVELYPAESRLVDAANQYFLWVLAQPGMRFPFGTTGRAVCEGVPCNVPGMPRQRPFERKPTDCQSLQSLQRIFARLALSEDTRKALARRRSAPPRPNDPCPCGKGKKHKRCCGARIT